MEFFFVGSLRVVGGGLGVRTSVCEDENGL